MPPGRARSGQILGRHFEPRARTVWISALCFALLELSVGASVEVAQAFSRSQLGGCYRRSDSDARQRNAHPSRRRSRGCDRSPDENGEFVASDPGTQLVLSHDAPERSADVAKHPISRIVPEGIVDELEVVEIDQDER
jgi:hypothetical protein